MRFQIYCCSFLRNQISSVLKIHGDLTYRDGIRSCLCCRECISCKDRGTINNSHRIGRGKCGGILVEIRCCSTNEGGIFRTVEVEYAVVVVVVGT